MENNHLDPVLEIAASDAPGEAEMRQSGVGATLREARERLGLSVDDVFARIKFAPRQIIALEADDFAQLPEAAFVRGFVRSYARLLQLDPERLLSALPQANVQPAHVIENKLAEVPFPNVYFARRHNIVWLAAALVVALALSLFTLLHGGKPNAPEAPVTPQVTVETLELPAVAVVPESAVAAVSAPSQVADMTQMPNEVDASAMKKDAGELPRRAGVMRMAFDGDSWVEVRDRDGRILLSQVNPRGSEQHIDGRPPFVLVIGSSAAVRLYYKGKQVDLAPHTKVSTARLTLE